LVVPENKTDVDISDEFVGLLILMSGPIALTRIEQIVTAIARCNCLPEPSVR